MQVSNSCVFFITIISFIAIFAFVIVSSSYWFFGKINSLLQSMSLANSIISIIKIAFLFVYPVFLTLITFKPFIDKIYRWKDNSDAWEEFHRKRDEYAEFHAEEKLIECKRNKANGNEWWTKQ